MSWLTTCSRNTDSNTSTILAAYAAEGLSHFIRRFNYTNNLIGTMNLVNASVNTGVECFVFTSSIAVYGPGQLPMTEEMTPEPEDPYGIAKYAVEMDLLAAQRDVWPRLHHLRPHNVYGRNQNIGDPYRNVIGIFMNQIMKGEPMTIFGDGEQTQGLQLHRRYCASDRRKRSRFLRRETRFSILARKSRTQ